MTYPTVPSRLLACIVWVISFFGVLYVVWVLNGGGIILIRITSRFVSVLYIAITGSDYFLK